MAGEGVPVRFAIVARLAGALAGEPDIFAAQGLAESKTKAKEASASALITRASLLDRLRDRSDDVYEEDD